MDWAEGECEDMLIPELIQHWTNEQLAPNILNQCGELLECIREQVHMVRVFVLLCAGRSKGRTCPTAAYGPGGE